jgi:hypothetical protein
MEFGRARMRGNGIDLVSETLFILLCMVPK